MEHIFETLPAAKKWSLVLCIISGISFLFLLLELVLSPGLKGIINVVMQGFLTYFLFAYFRACGAGIEDESEESLEEACRQQKNIFVIYGIQAAFMLLAFFLVAISLVIMAIAR